MPKYIERQKLFDALPTVNKDKQISLYGAVADFMIIVSSIPAADVVSREVFEQVKWERDTALQTLEEHGIGLGQKADVVEVVRCKNCKHWHEDTGWCYHHSHFMGDKGEFCHPWESANWKMFDGDDYCSDGERKEGAKNESL